MIAMALVNEPRILFLDDPGLGLDANDRHMIHTAVRSLPEREITTVYSTSNDEEASSLCHRVACMSEGRITDIGLPEPV